MLLGKAGRVEPLALQSFSIHPFWSYDQDGLLSIWVGGTSWIYEILGVAEQMYVIYVCPGQEVINGPESHSGELYPFALTIVAAKKYRSLAWQLGTSKRYRRESKMMISDQGIYTAQNAQMCQRFS